MQHLRQSTAITLKIGPFLDDTDGKTAETGLTIAQADVRLTKNGGDYAQKNEATSCTHDELGEYGCPLDTTDTNTLGRLKLLVHKSGALPVWHEFMVITANAYDSLHGTDKLEVDLLQVGGVAQSATDLKDFVDTGYDPSTHKVQGVVTVDTTTANSDMRGTDDAALASVCTEGRLAELDAANLPADITAILTDTGTTLDGKLDAIAVYLDTEIAAILEDTNELQTDWTNGGRLDLLIDLILADTNELQGLIADSKIAAQVKGTDDIDLSATQKASVNTEVSDVIKTDTKAEPAQGAPPATASLEDKIAYLYMLVRNKTETTETEISVYDDAGTTKVMKASVADDEITFTKNEYVSGA